MLPRKPVAATTLKMLPVTEYGGVNRDDPLGFYPLPVIGNLSPCSW
jgi:hypothetical protein